MLRGKSIIVAGGSGGLGTAVVEVLAARGANIVIGCRAQTERATLLSKRIEKQYEVRTTVVCGDLGLEETRREMIAAAQEPGELYGLVPLTGDPARVPIETATESDLLESMRINFAGPVLIARDFQAALRGADGAIVFVSTMQGVAVFPGSTTYAAPKSALVHTARILAKQWKTRINVVAPGVNDAGMAEASIRSGKYDRFIESGVIPRFGAPQDIAQAIAFFLEPDNYITGQVLTVDGGLSLKM